MQREVTLQHVDRVFLEREDGTVVQHAQQRYQPEASTRENLTQVGDLERFVGFFGLTGLCVQFLIHEEIDDEHHHRDAQQHDAECYRTGYIHRAAQFGEERREDHTGSYAETCQRHLRTHRHSGLTTFEPLHDTT